MKKARQGILHIGKPRVEWMTDRARLVTRIDSPQYPEPRDLWFEVDREYGKFLCSERSDAFLVGMLRYAMSFGYDIHCESPISEELLYNVRTYLIPALSKVCDAIYPVKIEAPLAEGTLPSAGAVGTGISCGIDSLHVLCHHAASEYPSMKLTHLVLNNVGAYQEGSKQFSWQVRHAQALADEYGFTLVRTNSNYVDAFPANHQGLRWTHTYANAFCVLALQKFWRTFYYGSSGYDLSGFSLNKVEKGDCALYDLLSLQVFSTRGLSFFSEGAAKTRFEKTIDVANYVPAKKYLHVCTRDDGPCCNTCEKCCRTIMTLDAIGKLDEFKAIFDVAYYRRNRAWYLNWMYYNYHLFGKESLLEEVYDHFKDQITFSMKVKMRLIVLYLFLKKSEKLRRVYRKIVPGRKTNAVRRELFGELPKK